MEYKNKILKSSYGFSLLEVLISIAILSFIMIGVITTTENSMNVKDRVIADDRRNLAIHTAMSRLEWDFAHIYSPLFYSRELSKEDLVTDEKSEETVEQTFNDIKNQYSNNDNFVSVSADLHPIPAFDFPEKNTISFFTASNRRKFIDVKQSNFAWVKYTLLPTPSDEDLTEEQAEKRLGTFSLVRYFYPDDPYHATQIEWEKMKGQVLLDGVKKLAFSFWDFEKQKFVDNVDVLSEGKHLIRGLRVDITWVDNDGIDRRDIKVLRPLFPYYKDEVQDLDEEKKEDEEVENET